MKSPQMPLRKITASLIAGAFLAGSAYADVNVQVREASLGAGMPVNLTLPVGTGNYFSGFQNIEVVNGSNTSSFAALCVDPAQYSSTSPTTYTTRDFGTFFGSKATEITQLYNYAYFDIQGDNQKAAAFQLALWEIANDDKDLNDGFVQITGSTDPGVANAALFLLNIFNQASISPTYNFAVYSSAGKQDFLVATPVPEPGTYAMFLAGLGLMGAIARRRTKAS